MYVSLSTGAYFFASDFKRCCLAVPGSYKQHIVSVESTPVLHQIIKQLFIFYCDDSLTNKNVIMQTDHPTKCIEPSQKLRAMLAL